MTNPVQSAESVIQEITDFQNYLLRFIDEAMSRRFGNAKLGKRSVLNDMGGIRTIVQMLNGVQFPKGHVPARVGCSPPIFENVITGGREALKASFTVEIIAIKENGNGQ